jgi:thiosulfate/3-mercaptopyruvate sulfurtransferase
MSVKPPMGSVACGSLRSSVLTCNPQRHPCAHDAQIGDVRVTQIEEGQTEPPCAPGLRVRAGRNRHEHPAPKTGGWSRPIAAEHLDAPDVVAVDGSWYLPAMQRPEAESRRPYTRRSALRRRRRCGPSNPLPHMLPDAEQFARDVGCPRHRRPDTIVTYDGAGLFSAPGCGGRFAFSAPRGVHPRRRLAAVERQGRPLEAGRVTRAPRRFYARKRRDVVASLDYVRSALERRSAQIVDARAAERFQGKAPEPRPGVRSGHMPGALNVPAAAVVENERLAPADRLEAAFAAGGVDLGGRSIIKKSTHRPSGFASQRLPRV